MKIQFALCTVIFLSSTLAASDDIKVSMTNLHSGVSAGIVTISSNQHGVVFTPELNNLPTGMHGFHLHEKPSCESSQKNGETVPGGAAGSHFDPEETAQHGTPWGKNNHKGDLPPLYVDEQGNASQPVLAPRLTFADLKGRALMVHANGDNYSDKPAPLGGGGARLACGVIE